MVIKTRFDGEKATIDFYLKRIVGYNDAHEHTEITPDMIGHLHLLKLKDYHQDQIHLFWYPPAQKWLAFVYYYTFEGSAGIDEDIVRPPCLIDGVLPIEVPPPTSEEIEQATKEGILVEWWVSVVRTTEGIKLHLTRDKLANRQY